MQWLLSKQKEWQGFKLKLPLWYETIFHVVLPIIYFTGTDCDIWLNFAKTWKDVSQHKCSSVLVFLCYAQWGSTPRPRFALHWLGSVWRANVCVCVCMWEREAVTKGVKIPYGSKINPLSHGLTFTEGWSVGVCEGVALWVCSRACCVRVCVCMRFPST